MWAKLTLVGVSILIGFNAACIWGNLSYWGCDWWVLTPLLIFEGLFILFAYLAWRSLRTLKWLDFKKVKGLKQ